MSEQEVQEELRDRVLVCACTTASWRF